MSAYGDYGDALLGELFAAARDDFNAAAEEDMDDLTAELMDEVADLGLELRDTAVRDLMSGINGVIADSVYSVDYEDTAEDDEGGW